MKIIKTAFGEMVDETKVIPIKRGRRARMRADIIAAKRSLGAGARFLESLRVFRIHLNSAVEEQEERLRLISQLIESLEVEIDKE